MTPVANEGKQQTCHGVRDEHRRGSEREEHAEEQRWPRVSPEAGGWAGKRRVHRHQPREQYFPALRRKCPRVDPEGGGWVGERRVGRQASSKLSSQKACSAALLQC